MRDGRPAQSDSRPKTSPAALSRNPHDFRGFRSVPRGGQILMFSASLGLATFCVHLLRDARPSPGDQAVRLETGKAAKARAAGIIRNQRPPSKLGFEK